MVFRDDARTNGNYHSLLGLHGDNGPTNGDYISATSPGA